MLKQFLEAALQTEMDAHLSEDQRQGETTSKAPIRSKAPKESSRSKPRRTGRAHFPNRSQTYSFFALHSKKKKIPN